MSQRVNANSRVQATVPFSLVVILLMAFVGILAAQPAFAAVPSVKFTKTLQTTPNESGTVTITAQLSALSGVDVSVPFTMSGTATENVDYSMSASPLVIPAGQLTGNITLTLIQDTLDEDNETAICTMGTPVNATKGSPSAETITISDDDPPPTVAFAASSQTVNEDAGTATVTVTLSVASGRNVSIPFTISGTAGSGNYTLATSNPLIIPPGQLTGAITLNLIDDHMYESDKTVIVTMGTTLPTGVKGSPSVDTVTIHNIDPMPSISVNDVSVSEGNNGQKAMTFTVSTAGSSENSVTVDYATSDGTATAGSDYVATNGTLTFAAGETSKTVTVMINGDTTNENDETLNLILSNASGGSIGDDTGVGTITNDDPEPTLSVNSPSVSEGDAGTTNLTFTVTLSAVSAKTVTADYATADGTATAGSDYTAASGSLTFAPGETSKTVTVLVSGDTTFENDETLDLGLSNLGNATLAGGAGVGTILNDDAAPTLSIDDQSLIEGDADSADMTFTVTLSAVSALTTTVDYATADGTATAGSDYTATSGTLTFAPGETSKTVTVSVLGDLLVENDETFTVNLSNENNATLADGQGVGTILNDDNPPIARDDTGMTTILNASALDLPTPIPDVTTIHSYLTVVGPGTITKAIVHLNLNHTYDSDLAITLIAPDGTRVLLSSHRGGSGDNFTNTTFDDAATSPISFGSAPFSGTFRPEQPLSRVNGKPVAGIWTLEVADTVQWDSGTLNSWSLTLDAFTPYTVPIHGSLTVPAVGVLGNDSSGNGGAIVAVKVTDPGHGAVTLNDDGSFTYTPDADFWGTDTFTYLAREGVNDSNTATVTLNVTPPSLSISDASATEGDTGTTDMAFTVTLSDASWTTTTVDYATADGTALAGSDYTTTAGTVTFAPGETTKTIIVPILNDLTYEPTKSLQVKLTNPNNATITDDTGVGTITDNDPVPTISIDDPSVTEGNIGEKPLTFTVSLSNPSYQTITVDYSTANDTATAGDTGLTDCDYHATSGTLTFAPGETTKTFDVAIVGDTTDENDETLIANLSNANNATIYDGAGVGTILDDDAAPTLSIDDQSVTEGDSGTTDMTFTVTLSAASEKTVTVDYATADDTATAGSDYTAASGTLTFAPGETSKTVTVTISGDLLVENDETFTVNLNDESNATLADAQGVGTILNDDNAPIARDDTDFTTAMDTPLTVQAAGVLTNDSSGNGGDIVAVKVTDPAHGAVTLNDDGSFTYTPDADFWGTDSFTYLAREGVNDSNAATVTVNVTKPSLSISDASATEGDAGTTDMTFTVTLSNASWTSTTVDYATTDGTALAGSDYTTTNGTLTFEPGETTKTITVPILSDTTFEPTESLVVNLSNPGNATLSDSQGVGTITDNDPMPTVNISDAEVTEGNTGTTPMTFTITLSNPSYQTIDVWYESFDDLDAVQGVDYEGVNDLVTFQPGETQKTVDVPVIGDTLNENDEQFIVVLVDANNVEPGTKLSGIGTIIDDDAVPTLSIDDQSMAEGNSGEAPMTFTVTLSAASGKTVTVDYATSNDSATAGNRGLGEDCDYHATSGALTFAPGETTKTINVPIVGDTTDEYDESFTVNLSNSNNADIADGQGIGTILNDDAAPVLSIDNPTAYEGDAGETAMTFTVTLSQFSEKTITVDYGTADGTAADGADYIGTSGTLTFAPGETSKTIDVQVIGDTTDEYDETFTVSLANPSNASVDVEMGLGTGTILDDDAPPTVAFTSTSQTSVGESGTMTITAQLSAASEKEITVPFNVSGTAVNPDDYTISSSPLIFAPGETEQTITINITEDTLVEPDKTVIVTLDTPVNANLGTDIEHTATISDDDFPTVTFTTASQASADESWYLTITAVADQTPQKDITIPLILGGTATFDDGFSLYPDYTIGPNPLVIPAGETSGDITISIISDGLHENNETVIVTMGELVNALRGDITTHTATITDDDLPPLVSLSTAYQEVPEGAGSVTVTADLSEIAGRVVTVPLTLSGTATADRDYVGGDYTITIQPYDLHGSITIPIIDDNINEDNETIIADMGTVDGARIGDLDGESITEQTIVILDNDPAPTVSINSQSAPEGDSGTSDMTFTVSLSAASEKTISVDYATSDDTATAGSDYTATSGTLTFAPGETSKTVVVPIIGDTIDENDETFVVNLSNEVNTTIENGQGVGTIIDDDAAPTISIDDQSVTEGNDGTTGMTFTISLSAPSEKTIKVRGYTADGTAKQGSDYIYRQGPMTFNPGETSKTVTIQVIGDTLNEPDETFSVQLTASLNATIAKAEGVGTILNDDPAPTVTFDKISDTSTDESGSYTVHATLSAASGQDVTVPFTMSGTATLDTDYTVTASPLVIPAGQTSGDITIAITQDTLDELDETAIVTMGDPTNATKGDTTVYTLTITDDDLPVVQFTQSSQSVAENCGSVTLTFALDQAPAKDVTVPLLISGSAENYADYLLPTDHVTIQAGVTSYTLTFPIINDINDEEDETIVVTMGTPVNAQAGDIAEHTVTILDDDNPPAVNFTVARRTVNEGVGTIQLYARSTVMSYKPITIPVTFTGTATRDFDYEVVTGEGSPLITPFYTGGTDYITIPAGSQMASIGLNIIDDTLNENAETIIATMGTPENATLGTQTTETVTITDNDPKPTISFTTDMQSVIEGGLATVTAQLSTASGKDVQTTMALSGTATDGTDYFIDSLTLTIPAGELTASTTITTIDDSLYEPNETIILTMGTPTNATLGANKVQTVTIDDNDSTTDLYVDDNWAGSALYDVVGDGLFYGLNAFDTVQGAVDAADDGYTIHVAEGTYYENVDIEDYGDLTLIGAGADSTIIDGMFNDTTLRVSDSSVTISGFTLTHGEDELDIYYTSGKISDCRMVDGEYSGIYAYDSELEILRNVIAGNFNPENWGEGGGVYIEESYIYLSNNLITGNTAMVGAGIYADGNGSGELYLANNTIVDNHCMPGFAALGSGSAVVIDRFGYTHISNNIIWGNEGQNLITDAPSDVYNNDLGSFNEATGGYGNDNINADPLFENGYHLQPGSPCINAGTIAEEVEHIDLDSNPRVVGPSVDMGTYEAQALPYAPVVNSIAPVALSSDLTTATVTIAGTGFAKGAVVTLSKSGTAVTATVTALTATSITTTINPNALGNGVWSVKVMNYDGQESTLADALTIMTCRPDLQIKAPADSTYLGVHVYNNPGAQTYSAATNGTTTEKALYDLLIANDGSTTETYTVTGPASSGGWTLRYLDASNTDVTYQVTGSGLNVAVSPSTPVVMHVEVTADAAVPGNATNSVTVTVTSTVSAKTDAVVAFTTKRALQSVALSTTKASPFPLGDSATMTATTVGGGTPEFKFRRGVVVGGVTTWDAMPASYTTNPVFTWTPTATGTYSFIVYAREVGTSTIKWSAARNFTVAPALSAVSLGSTPASPQLVGTTITLTATPTGGVKPEYRFKASYVDSLGSTVWLTLRDYAASNTWTGKLPTDAARTYSLYAYAREQGASVDYQVVSPVHTYITRNALSVLAMTVTPSAPSKMGTYLTVKGIPTGGANLEYSFKASYTAADGSLVKLTLRDYAASDTWTGTLPVDAPRTYIVYVYAREQGTTVTYLKSVTQNVTTIR